MARELAPDHVPGSISPSQIKAFEECPRRWGYEKIAGYESPSGPAAELGTRVHTIAELYFRTGAHPAHHEDVEAARVFESMMPHYPSFVDEQFEVEQHINLRFDDIDFHGFQDLGFYDDGRYVVTDHKTTGDFRWSKSEESLKRDPQGLIYALSAMYRNDVEEVELRWVYGRTRGANKSKVTRLVIDRLSAERNMREVVVPIARLIKRARDEGATAEDMPQNPSSCSHYGGCPFVGRCNLSPMDRLKAEFAMSSLREQLAAQKAAQKSLAASADTIKPIEPVDSNATPINPPERSKPGSLVAQLSTAPAAPAAPSAPAAPPAPGSMAEKMAKLRASKTSEGATKAPEPPAAPSTPSAPTAPPETPAATPNEVMHAAVSRHGPSVPMKGTDTSPQDEGTQPMKGYVLLIGCVPVGEKCSSAADIADLAHREFCEKRMVGDYRTIQYTGAAEFLAFFDATIALRMPEGYVFADINNPYVRVLLPSMEKYSRVNIRAVVV